MILSRFNTFDMYAIQNIMNLAQVFRQISYRIYLITWADCLQDNLCLRGSRHSIPGTGSRHTIPRLIPAPVRDVI